MPTKTAFWLLYQGSGSFTVTKSRSGNGFAWVKRRRFQEESEAKSLTEKEELLQTLEKELLPKIYGFCVLKMNTQQEAEDLSQEICTEVLKAIRSGKRIENLNAFVWSVSNHMFYNYLRRKRHGADVYLSELLSARDDPEEECILKEQKSLLRRELALMTGDYRKAVIMHYFDELSCEEIGAALGKSPGTVRWWLHDARKTIGKGMNTVREFGEKSFHPGALNVSCQGMPGDRFEPMSCVTRKSTQNILLAAYKAPVTVGELCTELGIAAPYVEDELEYLTENQLMREVSRGRYQTDFVILPWDSAETADKIREALFPAYYEKLIRFLEERKEILTEGRFNTAGFSWERLLWVYLFIITDRAAARYKVLHGVGIRGREMPLRPRGGQWVALGFDGSAGAGNEGTAATKSRETSRFDGSAGTGNAGTAATKSRETSRFDGSADAGNVGEGKAYYEYNGPLYGVGQETCAVCLIHGWSRCGAEEFLEIPGEVFALCGRVAEGKLKIGELEGEEKYLFSVALERKLFVETVDGFSQNFFYVAGEEHDAIERMAQDFYEETAEFYEKAYDIILRQYVKSIPPHLYWQMDCILSFKLNYLITCSLDEGLKRGNLCEPDENAGKWLSLYVSGNERNAAGEDTASQTRSEAREPEQGAAGKKTVSQREPEAGEPKQVARAAGKEAQV
ncbi:MAG: RNA polymerase sigma factor [bacterium]|nr:RNA polymerase sigma factor [bacterium]